MWHGGVFVSSMYHEFTFVRLPLFILCDWLLTGLEIDIIVL